MTDGTARYAMATGDDALDVAGVLVDQLRDPKLRLAVVFADWRLDAPALASALHRGLCPAPVVGCTTTGVIGEGGHDRPSACALGLYGDWVRAGVGVASKLPKAPLVRSRDAVHRAAAMLEQSADTLDPERHVAITLVDGRCGHEEAFCIGSAAAAPQIRFVGGSAGTELQSTRQGFVWAGGEALADAGVVVLIDSERSFEAVTSSHLIATDIKTVVTACSGRVVDELDGRPAADRVRELVARIGGMLDEARPSAYSLARFVDGVPYMRSITRLQGSQIHLASAVETGHVLRLMRPGDLIAKTRADLATAAQRVGGAMTALLVFSCVARHWEAAARGLDRELSAIYAAYPSVGFQSFGEQTGMLLVNHTLTALAIGAERHAAKAGEIGDARGGGATDRAGGGSHGAASACAFTRPRTLP